MNNTNTLILICVETNNKSLTDLQYIDAALKHYYRIGNEIKLDYLPMETKTKYNDNGIIKKINKKISKFDKYEIIYCLDTDKIVARYEDIKLNEEINKYCLENNIKIVWFCENIEDVFLHQHISDSDKVRMAKKFSRENQLGKSTKESLSRKTLTSKTSNLLLIFDEILEQKRK